jgi:hypothetical protein
MRQDRAARRRRETFNTDVLDRALTLLDVTSRRRVPGGAPNGGDHLEAVATVDGVEWELDGSLLADGLAVLFEDRADHGHATQLDGTSTAWRDRMLQARSVNSAEDVTPADALKILKLGIYAQDLV